jgi:hypothetical protein
MKMRFHSVLIKKFSHVLLLVGCVLLQQRVTVFAQSNAGTQSFPIMAIPMGAQAIGMGGSAMCMQKGELANGLENPALLDSNDRKKSSLQFMRYLAKSNGLQAMYVDYLDSAKITYSLGIKSLGYGELTRYDLTGTEMGTFRANDFLFQANASKKIDSLLTIGVASKVAYSQYDMQRMGAMALDIGGVYQAPHSNWTVAGLVKNVGFPLKERDGVNAQLPFDVQLGVSKRPKNAPFTYSVVYRSLQKWNLTDPFATDGTSIDPITGEQVGRRKWKWGDQLMRHLLWGVDFKLGSALHFYLGYNYTRRVELKTTTPGLTGISWGGSLMMKRWQFTYGGARWHTASTVHTLGIAFLPFSKL